MHTRRNLLIVLGAAPFAPRSAFAQAKKQPPLIGWVGLQSRESAARQTAMVKESLGALGWKEGSNVVFEERWADGRADQLAYFAKELAAKKPALIVTSGGRATTDVAKWAPDIPVVMIAGSDPVAAGVVASLARPGGMVTGVTGLLIETSEKFLELLVAAAPKVKRVGFLSYSRNPNNTTLKEMARRAVTRHQLEARFAEAGNPDEIEPALSRLGQESVQALVVLPGALLFSERQRIMTFALAQRWPVVGAGGWAAAGALLSYSADTAANWRRAAYYIDRILKGAKPGDLPIEQPMKFEMVLNMKTAKALGLTMPPEIMVRVDKVIE